MSLRGREPTKGTLLSLGWKSLKLAWYHLETDPEHNSEGYTMPQLIDSDRFKRWIDELPSPIAVPLVRIDSAFREDSEVGGLLAGLDAFEATLKWTTFLAIADFYGKLAEQDPFVTTELLKRNFAAIRPLFEPKPPLGRWVGCLRTLFQAYQGQEERFFVPELGQRFSDPNGPLLEGIQNLLELRNTYAHKQDKYPTPQIARRSWRSVEGWLDACLNALDPLRGYHLVQFYGRLHPEGSRHKGSVSYRTTCNHLRGYSFQEARQRQQRIRFDFPMDRPLRLNTLYLFDPTFRRHVHLHPFVLFTDLEDFGHSRGTKTFLFNELTARMRGAIYQPFTGENGASISLVDESDDETVVGMLRSAFLGLRANLSEGDPTALLRLDGPMGNSPLLRFQDTIDFHCQGFVGRENLFANIRAQLGGSEGLIWIRAEPGLGKTAFLARLARERKDFIHYFISNNRRTYNATVFLRHVCGAIIRKLDLEDEVLEGGELEPRVAQFHELLDKASGRLEGSSDRLVILVDALDESDRYVQSAEESIVGCLPKRLPPGVFLVVSSRPETDLESRGHTLINLEPLGEAEVQKILRSLGWGAKEAVIACRRSGGSPLYLRFLMDGIKSGELQSAQAGHLPKDMDGMYRELWRGWADAVLAHEQRRSAKKNQDKPMTPEARDAHHIMEVLGLLAVARESLSLEDLAALLDDPDPAELRRLLRETPLGRLLIGRGSYRLFHDTLRKFLLDATQEDDDRPHGVGIQFHGRLADWCSDWGRSEYGARHLSYHLLHGRRYAELVALLSDSAEEGYYRARTASRQGLRDLDVDLDIATEAARELNDLGAIFRFSLLRLMLRQLGAQTVTPGGARVLAALGRDDELLELVNGAESSLERIHALCDGLSEAFLRDPDVALRNYGAAFRAALERVSAHDRQGVIQRLLKVVPPDTTERRSAIRQLFPNLEGRDWARIWWEGLIGRPEVVLEALEEAIPEFDELVGVFDDPRLLHLAAGLFERDPVKPLRLVAAYLEPESVRRRTRFRWRGSRLLQAPEFESLRPLLWSASEPLRETLMRGLDVLSTTYQTAQLWEALPSIQFLSEWYGSEEGDRLWARSEELAADLRLLLRCAWARAYGERADLQAVQEELESHAGVVSLGPQLATLVWLVQGHRRCDSPAAEVVEAALRCVVDRQLSFLTFMQQSEDESAEWIAKVFMEMPGVASELAGLGLTEKERFFLSMALASPALPWLMNPEVQQVATRLLESRGGGIADASSQIAEVLIRSQERRLAAQDGDSLEPDDVQKLLLPVVAVTHTTDELLSTLDATRPHDIAGEESLLFALESGLSPEAFCAIWDRIADEKGDSPEFAPIAQAYLAVRFPGDPAGALQWCREAWECEIMRSATADQPWWLAENHVEEGVPPLKLPWLAGQALLWGHPRIAFAMGFVAGSSEAFWHILTLIPLEQWGSTLAEMLLERPERLARVPDSLRPGLLAVLAGAAPDHSWEHFIGAFEDDLERAVLLRDLLLSSLELPVPELIGALESGAAQQACIGAWIAVVARTDVGRAERMWEALSDFLAGRGQEFLAEFRTRVSGLLPQRSDEEDASSEADLETEGSDGETITMGELIARMAAEQEEVPEDAGAPGGGDDVASEEDEEAFRQQILSMSMREFVGAWENIGGIPELLSKDSDEHEENSEEERQFIRGVLARWEEAGETIPLNKDDDIPLYIVDMILSMDPDQELDLVMAFMPRFPGLRVESVLGELERYANSMRPRHLKGLGAWLLAFMEQQPRPLEFPSWSFPEKVLEQLAAEAPDVVSVVLEKLVRFPEQTIDLKQPREALHHPLFPFLRAEVMRRLDVEDDLEEIESTYQMATGIVRVEDECGPGGCADGLVDQLVARLSSLSGELAASLTRSVLEALSMSRPEQALALIEGYPLLDDYVRKESLGRIGTRDPARLIAWCDAQQRRGEELSWSTKMALGECVGRVAPGDALACARRHDLRPKTVVLNAIRHRALAPEELEVFYEAVSDEDDRVELLGAVLKSLYERGEDRRLALEERLFEHLEGCVVVQAGELGTSATVRFSDDTTFLHIDMDDWGYLDIAPLGLLYGCAPDRMTTWVNRIEAELETGGRECLLSELVMQAAIPWMVRFQPARVRTHLAGWVSAPWWEHVDLDKVVGALGGLSPEDATLLVIETGRAQGEMPELELRHVMDAIDDPAELHECLEILLSRGLQRLTDQAEGLLALVLEYSARAGHDPDQLSEEFRRQLDHTEAFCGATRGTSSDALLESLAHIASGHSGIADGAEDESSALSSRRTPYEDLTGEDRRALEALDQSIALLEREGYDVAPLAGQRETYLREARARV